MHHSIQSYSVEYSNWSWRIVPRWPSSVNILRWPGWMWMSYIFIRSRSSDVRGVAGAGLVLSYSGRSHVGVRQEVWWSYQTRHSRGFVNQVKTGEMILVLKKIKDFYLKSLVNEKDREIERYLWEWYQERSTYSELPSSTTPLTGWSRCRATRSTCWCTIIETQPQHRLLWILFSFILVWTSAEWVTSCVWFIILFIVFFDRLQK